MCYKCDNSVIMKINDIIVLLYALSHLYHYYDNPRVGPRAQQGYTYTGALRQHDTLGVCAYMHF